MNKHLFACFSSVSAIISFSEVCVIISPSVILEEWLIWQQPTTCLQQFITLFFKYMFFLKLTFKSHVTPVANTLSCWKSHKFSKKMHLMLWHLFYTIVVHIIYLLFFPSCCWWWWFILGGEDVRLRPYCFFFFHLYKRACFFSVYSLFKVCYAWNS